MGERYMVRGKLSDDEGAPLAQEWVDLKSLHDATSCTVREAASVIGRADGAVRVKTDEAGAFCVRAAVEQTQLSLSMHWAGKDLLDGVDAALEVDLSKRPLRLAFDPAPHAIDLDAPRIVLGATALVDEAGAVHPAQGLPVLLFVRAGQPLTRIANASGRLSWALSPADFGQPGKGELRVAFEGDAETAPASTSIEVVRKAKVEVRVATDRAGAVVPEDGVPIDVDVTWARGLVHEGSVEARLGTFVVGAAPVVHGKARLVATFPSGGSPRVTIDARYVPSTPWFEAGPDAHVTLAVESPSLWRQAPFALGGLGVLAWFLIARVGTARRLRPKAIETAVVREGVRVVASLPPREGGWSGRVIDVHDATPVQGARVTILRPSFHEALDVASAVTDVRGEFVLGAPHARSGDTLRVESRLHVAIEQPLPPPGMLSIGLTLRKRRLLDKLVNWARRQGSPFDARPEPTPAHVRRAAGLDLATAKWADAVEQAAFGDGLVDDAVEAQVDALAPKPVGIPPGQTRPNE